MSPFTPWHPTLHYSGVADSDQAMVTGFSNFYFCFFQNVHFLEYLLLIWDSIRCTLYWNDGNGRVVQKMKNGALCKFYFCYGCRYLNFKGSCVSTCFWPWKFNIHFYTWIRNLSPSLSCSLWVTKQSRSSDYSIYSSPPTNSTINRHIMRFLSREMSSSHHSLLFLP